MEDRQLPENPVQEIAAGGLELPPQAFPPLDLLRPPLELKIENKNYFVKDILRAKWLKLSPEEWVRQHVLYWLITQTKFPASLISIERKVTNGSFNRADVVGYGKDGKPLLLVECKAISETISKRTVTQAMKYNQHFMANYVWLTNGKTHLVYGLNESTPGFVQLNQLPTFERMLESVPGVSK